MAACLIVDDHPLTRDASVLAIRDCSPAMVVRQAESLHEALEVLAADSEITLVLLDLNLPESDGLDTLVAMNQWAAENSRVVQIVVLSGSEELGLVNAAVDQCATGFILKASTAAAFRQAIALTLAGGVCFPEYVLSRMEPGRADPSPMELTPHERQLLALLIRGHSYKSIARALEQRAGRLVAPEAVRRQVGNIAWKLGITGNIKQGVLAAVARRQWTFNRPEG